LRLTAISDPLTGLLNRRGWMSVAQSTFDRARREGAPLSAAILDLDRFKAINDAFGHPAGDAVLRSLAAVGRETLDDEQILGRIGGEEFGLLLPGLGVQQGVQTAERLRRAFAAVSHRLPEPVHCTLSVGVAERDLADPGLDALLSRADRALYEAKRAGRDRTMIGWPPASPRRTALA
jgi:diguanylate cyclase (GGDEF)-like protein